jgi:hypothetical protein
MRDQTNIQIRNYLILVFIFAWSVEGLIILGETSKILSGTVGFVLTFLLIAFGAGLSPVYASAILFFRKKQFTNFPSFLKIIIQTPNIKKTAWVTPFFFLGLFLINLANESYLGNPPTYFLFLFPLMILGGGLEEVGWRGYLQPLLEKKFSFVLTSLLIGITWGLWHLPLWFVQSANQSDMNFLSFFVYCISFSFIIGLLYQITRSTIACVLLHAWGNTLQGMFTITYLTQSLNLKISITWTCVILSTFLISFFVKHPELSIRSNLSTILKKP